MCTFTTLTEWTQVIENKGTKKVKKKVKIDGICVTSWLLNCFYWTQKNQQHAHQHQDWKRVSRSGEVKGMIFPPRRATKHQTIYLQSSLPAFYQASCRCILRLAQSQNFARLCTSTQPVGQDSNSAPPEPCLLVNNCALLHFLSQNVLSNYQRLCKVLLVLMYWKVLHKLYVHRLEVLVS